METKFIDWVSTGTAGMWQPNGGTDSQTNGSTPDIIGHVKAQ